MADDGNVKVFCRVRPPNEREGGATSFVKKCVAVPSSDPLQQTVMLQLKGMGPQAAPKTFTFDRVFSELSSQNEVFEIVGVPITKACLEGYNGTIFAYGQTGSGKTFTMQGPDDVIDTDSRRLTDAELGLRGVVPRVFDYLFQDAASSSNGPLRVPIVSSESAGASSTAVTRVEHTFACSFMEIYNERVYDLLDLGSTRDAAGLILRENGRKGVFVEGLIESVVGNAKQAAELMSIGARNRRVGQTAMNRESSRSHSVFVLQIQSKETTAEGVTKTRMSRFNLVDLAGSERQKNTEAAGDRLKEAGSINKSLSALGNVIMGLVEQSAGKNRHVHYRDSKLTFLLKDSLGGNSKTFMIATVSPAEDSSHETLSTLKFAQRAKLIRNNAVINEDTSGSVLVLQEEILRLRRQLQEAHGTRGTDTGMMMAEARLTTSSLASLSSETAGETSEIGERLLDLESALAFSLEKNDDLLRSNGQMSMQSGHLKDLCSELKKTNSHLKLRLRLLRSGAKTSEDVAMVDDEPSADAIEWRMKYEEMEEAYFDLQERSRGAHNSIMSTSNDQSREVQQLNFMYLTLTKQLAVVIRDKHELANRLQDKPPAVDEEVDKLAQLEEELSHRSLEFESKLNELLTVTAAAEDKAQSASLELLHSKQKEAAWKISQHSSEIAMNELHERIGQMEVEARQVHELLLNEKRQRLELENRVHQDKLNAQQAFDESLADKTTEIFELKQLYSQANNALSEVRAQRDDHDQEISRLRMESTAHRDEIEALLATRVQNETKLKSLSRMCADLERTVMDISKVSEEKSVQIDALKDTMRSLTADCDHTKAELAACMERNEALANTERTLREKCRGLEEELRKSSELLQITEEAMRECNAELAERTESYEASITSFKKDQSNLTARHETTVAEHDQYLSGLVAKHQEEVVRLNLAADQLVNEHQARVEQLGRDLHDAEARFQDANQVHEAQTENLRRAVRDVEDLLGLEKQEHSTDKQRAQDRLAELTKTHENELLSQRSEAAAQRSESDETIESLNSAIGEAHNTIRQREATISDLGNTISKLEEHLSGAEGKIEECSSAIQGLEAERDGLQSEILATKTKLVVAVEGKSAAEIHVATLTGKLDDRTKLVHQHEATIASHNEWIRDLEKQLADLTCERDGLVVDLEKARDKFNYTVAAHEAAIVGLRTAHTAEVARLSDETSASILKLESAVASLNSDLKAKMSEIESLQATIKTNLSTIARVETLLVAEGQEKADAQKNLANTSTQLEERERDVVEKNEAIDRALHQMDALQEETNEERVRLSGRIQLLEADLVDLRRAYDVLKSSHNTLTEQHDETVVQKRCLETTNADNMRSIEELTAQLRQAEAQIDAMAVTISELKSSLGVQAETSERRQKEKEVVDGVVADLQQLVARRDDEIDEKDSVISGMEETVENLEAEKARTQEELDRVTHLQEETVHELSSTKRALELSTAELAKTTEKLTATEVANEKAAQKHTQIEQSLQEQLKGNVSDIEHAKNLISFQQDQLELDSQKIESLSKQADDLSSRKQLLEKTIEENEVVRQNQVKEHQEMVASWTQRLTDITDELQNVKSARDAAEQTVRSKSIELDDLVRAHSKANENLDEALKKTSAVEDRAATDLRAWTGKELELRSQIDVLQHQISRLEQAAEALKEEAEQVELSSQRETQQLRQELDHSVEKATRFRKKNEMLQELNSQLSQDVEQMASAMIEAKARMAKLESELERVREIKSTTEEDLRQTQQHLSSATSELETLHITHEKLASEYAAAKDGLEAKKAAWEAKNEELKSRTTVVEEMEVQTADESKKLADEKVVVAQRKKQIEKILREYEELKTRVAELEILKTQLSKEKEKYRREVNILTTRLEDTTKENDKLVGHHNKRQKIQHHFKVKEENNKLIEDVKQLTEEKYKLEVRVEKLELTLKEKENLVNSDQVVIGSSFDDNRSTASSVHSNASQKLFPVVSSSSTSKPPPIVETSALSGVEGSAKKRLRSRIE